MTDEERPSRNENEIYRLRSVSSLLQGYEELQNQQIYFADPDELNDPMEGFVEFHWTGDEIVWRNLFRNYIYALHHTITMIMLIGDREVISQELIPVEGNRDDSPLSDVMQIVDEIYNDIVEKTDLSKLIGNLASAPQGTQHDEVKFYLQSIHASALRSIGQVHAKWNLSQDKNAFPQVLKPPILLSTLPTLIDQFHHELIPEPRRVLGGLFSLCERIANTSNFVRKYTFRNQDIKSGNILQANRELVILDFPRVYVDQLSRLIRHDWYVACFMKDYRNSSVWGHYGCNHKGACLIFSPDGMVGNQSLSLKRIVGFSISRDSKAGRSQTKYNWDVVPMKFHDVKYQRKIEPLDFFRNIGVLPIPLLLRNWYCDASGERSECGSHIGSSEEDSWREEYWSKFYEEITVKTRDWKYEEECRLILHSSVVDLTEKSRRAAIY